MNRQLICFTIITLFFFSSCLIKPEEAEKDLWFPVLMTEINTPLRNIHSTTDELYAISDDEFLRFNKDNEILERRSLLLPLRFFGRPTLSDDAFMRVTRQNNNTQIIEFHSTKTPNQTLEININNFSNPGEELVAETNSRYTGAFNETGDQFLLPCFSLPDYFVSCLLLDIKFNPTRTAILEVSINRRINVTELPADFQTLQNTHYFNGHYYLTSLDGAFRVSPNGDVLRIFRKWMFDVFEYNSQLYVTSSDDKLFSSTDNGLTWERVGTRTTELRYVEIQNDRVFTHPFLGARFKLAQDDLLRADNIRYNLDFPDDLAAYTNIRFFNQRYFLTVQKQLYYTSDLQTQD